MSVAVVLGSAFDHAALGERELEPVQVDTPSGAAVVHRLETERGDAWVLFRHGAPHEYLPNQIPYRAQALALSKIGCRALLVTSSVGVLDPTLPLDLPILVTDLITMDNRLPNGEACTIFSAPQVGQGHLVLDEGLLSRELNEQLEQLLAPFSPEELPRAVFAYVGGPRTKTAAENAMWRSWGAQINSMTVGPEIVLANELEIPVAAVGVGHKYSVPGIRERLSGREIEEALATGRELLSRLVTEFLDKARPVPFRNRIYRY